jgi:hypothetical protein
VIRIEVESVILSFHVYILSFSYQSILIYEGVLLLSALLEVKLIILLWLSHSLGLRGWFGHPLKPLSRGGLNNFQTVEDG